MRLTGFDRFALVCSVPLAAAPLPSPVYAHKTTDPGDAPKRLPSKAGPGHVYTIVRRKMRFTQLDMHSGNATRQAVINSEPMKEIV